MIRMTYTPGAAHPDTGCLSVAATNDIDADNPRSLRKRQPTRMLPMGGARPLQIECVSKGVLNFRKILGCDPAKHPHELFMTERGKTLNVGP